MLITGLYDMSKDTMAGNNYYPWLENYPEATKALLMAASTNNIQDGPVSNDPAVDERDGAGALDVAELEDIWNSGRWSIRLLDSGDAMNVRWRWVWLDAGDDLRAYMAWSRCPSNTISDLHADFDLRLRGPDGSWVAFGDSFDQTYEGVQYTAQSSGWHSIHSIRWFQGSCGGSQADIVGLAYQRL